MTKATRFHAVSNMDGQRYGKLIARLGLSQRGAARFLGVSDTQSARMATDRVSIPPPIAMLLEIMVAHQIEPAAALKLIGINVGKAEREARSEHISKAPRFFMGP